MDKYFNYFKEFSQIVPVLFSIIQLSENKFAEKNLKKMYMFIFE